MENGEMVAYVLEQPKGGGHVPDVDVHKNRFRRLTSSDGETWTDDLSFILYRGSATEADSG